MSDSKSQNDDRRAFVRYRRRLDILWQMLGLPPRDMVRGKITDLSVNGVGLTVDQPFSLDSHLMVRLPSTRNGWTTHLLTVHHCKLLGPGCYQRGCSFVRPLTPEQLAMHLD